MENNNTIMIQHDSAAFLLTPGGSCIVGLASQDLSPKAFQQHDRLGPLSEILRGPRRRGSFFRVRTAVPKTSIWFFGMENHPSWVQTVGTDESRRRRRIWMTWTAGIDSRTSSGSVFVSRRIGKGEALPQTTYCTFFVDKIGSDW